MALPEEQLYPFVDAYILPQSRTTKPVGSDIGHISNHITSYPAHISIADFAYQVGNSGMTTVPCTLSTPERKKENFLSTNLIMIDVDNGEKVKGVKTQYTGDQYLPLSKVLADPFTQKYAAFVYETFSSTADWNRFRIVFVLDQTIADFDRVSQLYQTIGQHYGNYDSSVTDPTRLMFGGNSLHIINLSNTLSTQLEQLVSYSTVHSTIGQQVLEQESQKPLIHKGLEPIETCKNSLNQIPKNEENKRNFLRVSSSVHQVCEMFKRGEYEEIKERWIGLFAVEYRCTEYDFFNQVTHMDMKELLDLPDGSFIDLLHEETNPSALVFVDDESGRSLYKCFSASAPFTGNIFEVVAKLTGKMVGESYYLVADLMGVTLTDSFKDRVDKLYKVIRTMEGNSFSKKYPNTNRYFKQSLYDVKNILKFIRKNGSYLWLDEGQARHLFYMSSETIAEGLYGKGTSKGRSVRRVLTMMSLTGWIQNLSDDDIPKPILARLNASKLANKANGKGKTHRVNVYSIPDIGDDFLNTLESICKMINENGGTHTGLSKEFIINLLGQETSDKVFVQDKGRIVSKESLEFENEIVGLINERIIARGFAVEKEVVDELSVRHGKTISDYKMKQIRPSLIQNYGFERVRLTASLKEKLGITDNFKDRATPVVYIVGQEIQTQVESSTEQTIEEVKCQDTVSADNSDGNDEVKYSRSAQELGNYARSYLKQLLADRN